ncbi:DUF1272 domain-containing protein [Metabacillus litoralis]|uniref:DUF1272 domain-containing protein n=1 Tax=Metabacillus litoralis TaxID=152268 RepID=UPI00203FB66D|nr:DUF1272 domain-containing protein [Metabacillus litoralis]MCM3163711.1 DUF1272 domain-containing protein [Metabacillus litoralis]MCM3409957.1 DUF1272 domain-containing protein [Metabacillus litoralis]
MSLEMRKECEKCHSELKENSNAYICVYECTFCEPCTINMENVCPNCGGELVRRPRKPSTV